MSEQYTTHLSLRSRTAALDSSVPFTAKLAALCRTSEADFHLSGNMLEIHGDSHALIEIGRKWMQPENADLAHQLQALQMGTELSVEYHEFITGKKNGKLNKIIKSCHVQLDLLEISPYSILLDMRATSFPGLMSAFQQLRVGLVLYVYTHTTQDELPAELKFYVPDVHHKRIIGVGGKNIQSIMKTYGVYVKFSSGEEFNAVGGLLEEDNNVLARTPAKNAVNLGNLHRAVMEQVDPDFAAKKHQVMSVPRRYHAICQDAKQSIEEKTNGKIRIPSVDSAAESITLFGTSAQVATITELLQAVIKETHQYRVSGDPKKHILPMLSSNDYKEFMETSKKNFQITISIDNDAYAGKCTAFYFHCTIVTAKKMPEVLRRFKEVLQKYSVSLTLAIAVLI